MLIFLIDEQLTTPVTPMNINHKKLIPAALKELYPDMKIRKKIEKQLSAYGVASHHREKYRVVLGILYLASKEPEKLSALIEMACTDYRDLLRAAEYPHSSRHWELQKRDPEEYKKLQRKEEQEYMAWVEEITRA